MPKGAKKGSNNGGGKRKGIALDRFTMVANDYLKECEVKKKVPFQQEFAWLLGIDHSTLSTVYSKKPQYSNVIKRINEINEMGLINKGLNDNKPVFAMFLLKAKHGYIEAQYQKVDLHVSGLGNVVMPPKKPKVVSD